MSEHDEQTGELDPEELDRQEAEPLPDREAMSIISPETGAMPPLPVETLSE